MELKHFIKTQDEQTKNILIEMGFRLLNFTDNIYTFLNDETITFNEHDLKVTFSDNLFI